MYFLFLSAIFFLSFNAFTQPNEFKLIKKQKFEKLESMIVKQFSKNPGNCRTHYILGVLQNQKIFKGTNPELAYSNFNSSLSAFYYLDEKEKNKILKEGITADSILFHRNISCDYGLELAIKSNTIDAYQHFIEVYVDAYEQKGIAVLRRDELAYTAACFTNTEDSYTIFLNTYPNAIQRADAILRRDERGFENAKNENRSSAIIAFIKKYPDSHLRKKAEFEKNRLFFREQTDGTVSGYIRFCSNNERSEFYEQALDSISTISLRNRDLKGLKYIATNSNKVNNYSEFQDKLIGALMFDGNSNTLDYFKKEFYSYLDRKHQVRIDDYANLIDEVDHLFLKIGVTDYNYTDYEKVIISLAPSDIAFVALQRLIEKDIKLKDWVAAISKLQRFEQNFQMNESNKASQLITLLESQNLNVQIQPLKGVNSMTDEYAPVPSIDGKRMLFCGKGRKDNIGGEDIFVANLVKQQFVTSGILESLSTNNGNEAPLSVSADGSTIFLWTNENKGDILTSTMQKDGKWSMPIKLPSPINSDYYEGDAMLSADGKSLFFVSSRPGGQNIYSENPPGYFGDDNYPTDIYVSRRLINGNWSEPVNLGPEVNTQYSERGPYIHPDGKTLYFSSEGHSGIGRLDVYMTTTAIENNFSSWTSPKNLGKEINTTGNDWGFKFSTDGKKVYYAAKNQTTSPSSLVLLLDISGSMDGSKIQAMREAASEVCLNALENNTEVAILAFEGDCSEPINDFREFTIDARDLTDFISGLQALGGTPMYEALFTTAEYLKTASSTNSKNRSIILMSDGDATSCVSMRELFKELKVNKYMNRVYTIALEVDEQSKAYEDLQYIAQTTGGEFFHAESSNDLGNAFAQASNKIFNFSLKQSNSEIFEFILPVELRPAVVSTISGVILDVNKKPIEANILWEDLVSGEQIGIARSNPVDGSYFIVLPSGRNYGYFVDHPSFFPASNSLDLRNAENMLDIQVNVDVVSYEEMINLEKSVKINNLFFETAKYDIKQESNSELNRVAEILKRSKLSNMKIEISGHTDNVGDADYNKNLSELRANAVANYLISKGVDASMIVVNGFGYTKPVVDNNSEANRALNRRVELKLMKP